MKKLFVLMLSVSLIFAVIHPCFAEDRVQDNQVEYTYFEDGCYIISIISDETTGIERRSTTTTTKSKTSTYYNNSDVALWYVKVTGSFTYGDGSAKCNSSSVTAGSYSSNWKISDKSASKSGASATAKATGKLYDGSIVIQTVPETVTLTCTSQGTFY